MSAILILWALVVATAFPAVAGTVILDRERVDLSGHLEVFEDPSAALSVTEIARDRAGDFRPLPGHLTAGFSKSGFWLRFAVEKPSQDPHRLSERRWLLEVEVPFLDHVDLYTPDGAGGYFVQSLGDRLPFAERPVKHRNFLFPIALSDDGPRTFLLHVRSSGTVAVRATLWTEMGFAEAVAREAPLLGAMHGAIVVIVLFSLIQFATTREPIWGLYALYALFSEATFLANNGYASQYLFARLPAAADGLVGLASSGTLATGALFTRHLLDLRRRHPRLDLAYMAAGAVGLIVALSVPAGLYGTLVPLNHIAGLFLLVASPLIALQMALRGDGLGWGYLAVFAPYLTAGILLILRNLGLPLLSGDFVDWGMQLGMVLHMLLLSLLLVRRLALIEDEKRAIQTALAAEQAAMREQRNFLSMVTHEFRTPLSVIGAAADLIELSSTSGKGRKVAAETVKIRRALSRLAALIDSCLTDDWLDTSMQDMHRRPVAMGAMLAELCEERKDLAGQRLGLELTHDPLMIEGDESLLRVLFANLIDNAVKYAPPEGKIRISLAKADDRVRVTVADDGPGVAPEEAELVFAKFYRSPRTTGRSGTGLGLHLVRRIAERHHGLVWLDTEAPKGATFVVELPVRQPEADRGREATPGRHKKSLVDAE